jgi:hypothetical protein
MFSTALITENPSVNGVHVFAGTFNLYGGEISRNALDTEGTCLRSGVVINGGKFNMAGGKILDNGTAPGSAIAVVVYRYDTLSDPVSTVTLNGEVAIRGSILSGGNGGYFKPGNEHQFYAARTPKIMIGPLFANAAGPIPMDLGWNYYFMNSRSLQWNGRELFTLIDGLSAIDPALFPLGKVYRTGPKVTTGTVSLGEVPFDKLGIASLQLGTDGMVTIVPLE